MHHEAFVEPGMVHGHAAVPDMDHRGLREGGEELVGGLRGKDCRTFRVFCPVPHRKPVPIDRVEPGIGIPGLVEMDAIHALPEKFLHLSGMVAEAIVGGVGDDRMDRGLALGSRGERAGSDLIPDRSRGHLVRRDRADDPVPVPGREEIDRDRVRHGQGMLRGLVAVPVHEHDIVLRDPAEEDDLVCCRGAVRDEVRQVRAEDLRCIPLGLPHGAGVVQQGAEFPYRD